ncbi:MAG: hypothetical protein H6Q90_2155 [Deltaproteobacteria bacterium]|nr:hypothetical protein [Deltaproteobacteria bacterium]
MRPARVDREERGFTLIELMIAVVIIGVLAAIAVPFFLREARKTKGDAEVMAMFTEVSVKQDRYKGEAGSYLAVPTCPTTPSAQLQSIAACTSSASWLALGLQSPTPQLRCSYAVTIGAAGVNPSPPAGFTLPTSPANGWYFIVATCNMDGSSTINSQYLQSSLDSTVQKVNEGN